MPDIVAGLIGIGLLVLWVYCIFDVITTAEAIVRHLPKWVWFVVVLLLGAIGSFLWLGLGRPQLSTRQARNPVRYRSPRPLRSPAPMLYDAEAAEAVNPIVQHREEQARLRMLEAQLKRREDEFRRQLDGGSTDTGESRDEAT